METKTYDAILHYLKLESVYYSRSSFGGNEWGVDVPAYDNTSMFHIVTAGTCEVEINGNCIQMNQGDVLFISRACGHIVRGADNDKAIDLLSLPVDHVSEFYETLELNSEETQKTIILCGVVKITHPSGAMLINEMPDVIHVKRKEHMFNTVMDEIVQLMFREANGQYLGGETVITRLADVLMIQTIRHWVESASDFHGRWLNALKDGKIGKALASIHSSPEKNWTIESLGKEVGMSRTAFANKFRELIDQSPMNYLTTWRMNLAKLRISNGEKVDLDFIESLGYQSESAFRRAFKKVIGVNVSEV
ncbi:AraC family transcriptional regulator [Aliikangiella marina]|uniref:AraC family transcriptional regulator n=1 Tax=Aliikangiella marina TaxID=1712262 RepID=A0A545T6W3_9GAMM|nr:AraC family transcriptional regulator [Aliikangiella marina]TQV72912.1 AraC family transcriptional regulator [Aliikangiella marina]